MDKKNISKECRYFLKDLETLSGYDLKRRQFEKTKETLERAYQNSGFYRDRFDEAGVKPGDFRSLDDIRRFPFIDKKDLVRDQEENPHLGRRVCVPPGDIRRINLTSGTSGMGQERSTAMTKGRSTQPTHPRQPILQPSDWRKGIFSRPLPLGHDDGRDALL